jgi:hypothetical protein
MTTFAENDRLAKLLKLIFISDKPGEITAGVAAVRRILASENIDAHWLADRLTTQQQHQSNEQDDEKSSIWCHRRHLLSSGDREFIETVANYHKPLSAKQQKWLQDICEKLEHGAAA